MLILWHFQGEPSEPNFFGDSPMGLLSPLESSEVGAIGRSHKLHFCKWHFSPIFTQPNQIELFLLISSNKFLLNGYKHSGTLFLGPHTITFSKIQHMFGVSADFTQTVFLYLYLCICVFVLCICMSETCEHYYLGPGTISFSKIQHLLGLSANLTKLYLCICVFVFVCLVP